MTSEKCWNLKYVLLVFLETLITLNLRYQVQLKNMDKSSKVRQNKFKDTFYSLMV